MTPLVIFATLSLAAQAADPATSQAAAAASVQADAAKTAPDPNKMICKSVPRTGSHFEGRQCLTRQGWTELEQRRARANLEFQRHLGSDSALPKASQGIGAF